MKPVMTGWIIVLIAFLLFAGWYAYPDMLQLLPQGSHLWRQADCLAMTLNYRQFDLSFLQPATYNLQSIHGSVAGEFPLFYFIAATFEHPAFALRALHTSICMLGISATYFIAFHFLQRRLLSVLVSCLLFTSPLLVFYGNNFLSDVPALSFGWMGWAFFLYGHRKEKLLGYWVASLFFAMAALLKASESMHFVLAFLWLIASRKGSLSKYLSFLWGIVPLAWYGYAKQYNAQHSDTYYFLNIAPVWTLSPYDIGLGIWRMVVSLSNNYFWRPTSVLMIAGTYYVFKHRKRLDRDLKNILLLSLCGLIVYILLFYQKMIGHEYYYTPFFIFLLFLLIVILKTYNFFHAENVFTHAAFFLFLLPNMLFCNSFVSSKLRDSNYNPV